MSMRVMTPEDVTLRLERMIAQRDALRELADSNADAGRFSRADSVSQLPELEERIEAYATYWSLEYDA